MAFWDWDAFGFESDAISKRWPNTQETARGRGRQGKMVSDELEASEKSKKSWKGNLSRAPTMLIR